MAKAKKKPIKKLSLAAAKSMIPINLSDLNLKPRELKFIAAYCSNGFNQKNAYIAAGYEAKVDHTQRVIASRMLSRADIQLAVRRFLKIIIEPYREKLEYMLMEVHYRRAFYDIATFYDSEGKLLDLDDIPEEWHIVIDGIDQKLISAQKDGEKKYSWLKTYKLADREQALKALWAFLQDHKGMGLGIPDLPEKSRKKLKDIFDGNYKKTIPFKKGIG